MLGCPPDQLGTWFAWRVRIAALELYNEAREKHMPQTSS